MSKPNILQTSYEIGNKRFLINHWRPTKVYKNMPKIGKYFVVPLSIVMSSGDAENLSDTIPTAVVYLFNEMEENDIMDLFQIILEDTHLQGQSVAPKIDEIFMEDPQELLELVAKVLEVNYKSFFQKKGFESLLKMVSPIAQAQDLYPQP